MGRLILCSQVRAERPFFIRCIEKNVYTMEELCFFFYNELYFAYEFSDWNELSMWLGNEMKLEALAKSLKKISDGVDKRAEAIGLIFEAVSYRSVEQIKDYEWKLQQVHDSTGFIRIKRKADYLVKNRRYNQSIELYREVLADNTDLEDSFLADVYHNMGVSFGRMFYFEKAAECFSKAFSIMPSRESLKQYKLALRLSEKEEDDDDILDEPSVVQLDSLLDYELEGIMESEFGGGEPLADLEELKSEGRVGEYYEKIQQLLDQWKEECRGYM